MTSNDARSSADLPEMIRRYPAPFLPICDYIPPMSSDVVPDNTATQGAEVLAALADETRRKVYSMLVLDAATTQQISQSLALTPARCAKALTTLHAAGLLQRTEQTWSATSDIWRGIAPRRPELPETAQTHIPAKQGKRRAFLEGLVPRFEPERQYPEKIVNEILGEVNPDFAALRRYLVEEGLLKRENGVYWRP